MSFNPPIRFQVTSLTRQRLGKIADFHGLGSNEPSANEVAKLVTQQASLIKPAKLMEALAALKPYQVTNPFALGAFGPSTQNRSKQPKKIL